MSKQSSSLHSTLAENVFNMEELKMPAREFRVEDKDPALQPKQQNALEDLANCKGRLQVFYPKSGRSIYAQFSKTADYPIPAFKMKGVAGLSKDSISGEWSLQACRPDKKYCLKSQAHFKLDEELNVGVSFSAPKALYSLTAQGAKNEYECQGLLAKEDLGFRPLMYGKYISSNTQNTLLDVNGNQIGAVFLGHDSHVTALTPHILFVLLEDTRGLQTLLPHNGKLALTYADPHSLIENYLEILSRTAFLKRNAALHSGVMRHASQPDNFLYDSLRDKIYISDTDSCIKSAELSVAMRGPQMLRDLSADIKTSVMNLSYFSYSNYYLREVENSSIKPFHAYLLSFFKDLSEESVINDHADRLHEQYLKFLNKTEYTLSALSAQLRKGILSGKFDIKEIHIRETWQYQHAEFLSDCLDTCYLLMSESTLYKRRFTLPKLSEGQRKKRFKLGIAQYREALIC